MRFKSCACGSENCKLIIAECERVDRVPSFRTAPRISDKVKQAAMWDTYTKAVAITAVKSTSKFGTWALHRSGTWHYPDPIDDYLFGMIMKDIVPYSDASGIIICCCCGQDWCLELVNNTSQCCG